MTFLVEQTRRGKDDYHDIGGFIQTRQGYLTTLRGTTIKDKLPRYRWVYTNDHTIRIRTRTKQLKGWLNDSSEGESSGR